MADENATPAVDPDTNVSDLSLVRLDLHPVRVTGFQSLHHQKFQSLSIGAYNTFNFRIRDFTSPHTNIGQSGYHTANLLPCCLSNGIPVGMLELCPRIPAGHDAINTDAVNLIMQTRIMPAQLHRGRFKRFVQYVGNICKETVESLLSLRSELELLHHSTAALKS